jgi:ArsR family transcriptional regulator
LTFLKKILKYEYVDIVLFGSPPSDSSGVDLMTKTARVDCVSPDRSSEDLIALKRDLAGAAQSLRRVSEHYALLAGETRLKIMALLRVTGELCVCDLATVLEMTPAAVSQHLGRLRSGGLVRSRRDGMTIYYRLAENRNLPMPVSVPRLHRSKGR